MAPPDPRRSSRLLDSLCERRASASTPTDSAVAEKAHIVRSGAEELDKRGRTWVTPMPARDGCVAPRAKEKSGHGAGCFSLVEKIRRGQLPHTSLAIG